MYEVLLSADLFYSVLCFYFPEEILLKHHIWRAEKWPACRQLNSPTLPWAWKMTCEYMLMCTLQCIDYCTISVCYGSLYLKLMNALCVHAFAWRIVFSFTFSSSSFVLTCTTGTMRMTSLQPTVFQTCLWRLIWMTVSAETRAPLQGLRPHRCVQSTAVPQKLEQVKKKNTFLSYFAISYVSFICKNSCWNSNISWLLFWFLISFGQSCLQAFSRLLSLDIKITWMQKYGLFFFSIVLIIAFN